MKPSDKYLLQKFNREFDAIRDQLFDVEDIDLKQKKSSENNSGQNFEAEPQQFSPESGKRKTIADLKEKHQELHGVALNYLKFKDLLVRLGCLTDFAAMSSESEERALLYDMWVILKGEETETIYVENLRVLVQVIMRMIDGKRVLNVPPNKTQLEDG